MSDVKQDPGGFKINADAAMADALASVERRQNPTAEGEVPLEVAPAEAAPPPPPDPPKRTPQDAIIEALVKAKAEALEALAQTQHEAKDLLEARARIQAEFENYRKRVSKEKQEAKLMTTQRLARDLLPALDNLERALAHLDPASISPEMKNLVTGITLVGKQFAQALKNVGVVPFDSKGQTFDPARHEAVSQMPATEGVKPGSVMEEHQRGYMLGEQLLRPALVVVAGEPETGGEPPSA